VLKKFYRLAPSSLSFGHNLLVCYLSFYLLLFLQSTPLILFWQLFCVRLQQLLMLWGIYSSSQGVEFVMTIADIIVTAF